MIKGSNKFKFSLLTMIFIFMFIHMIYDHFNFIRIPPLKGDIRYSKKPALTIKSWFNGDFQQEQETFINEAFGFRSLYVRLNNQIGFSLFDKINAKKVVLGKSNYLFEESYIAAYTGKDFIGEDSINIVADRIKFVSDTLAKLNKQLIIIFAAGKASFYPEYIPDKYFPIKGKTNYKALSQAIKDRNITHIDFNKWFMAQKWKSKYPLYPQCGIHWSNYGALLAADSIIKQIEYLRKIDMPNLIFDMVEMKFPIEIDYDIAAGMNLLFKFKTFKMAYPVYRTESFKKKTKPSVLVVSDSFYWGMYYFGISKSFKNDHFWYYNHQVYPESSTKEVFANTLDLRCEIQKNEVIILMATEASLKNFGWGFLENLEKHFRSNTNK